MNDSQEHVPGASSIPKRPSQPSGQPLSNAKRQAAPSNRLTSISRGNTEKPEQSSPLAKQSTDKPEQPLPISKGNVVKPEQPSSHSMGVSMQSNEVEKRSSLAEMATMRLDAARLSGLPRTNTHLTWKKVRVSYSATVNVRRAKKRVV